MSAPPPPRDLLFEAEHLSLAYAGNRGQPSAHILKGVSVAVERGSALVLVGPSGSGKSTLLQCLNRLVEPIGGRVRFDGHDVRSLDPRELRRRVALVMQTPVLFEGSVRDNLRVRPAGTPGDFSDASLASAAV
jgi:ABC-type multidrug transport system fused ATPase/permease subunit